MYHDKSATDAQLDLSLYIEGLLTVDEIQPEHGAEQRAVELVETASPVTVVETAIVDNEIQSALSDTTPLDCLAFTVDGTLFMLPAGKVVCIERVDTRLTRIPLDSNAFRGRIRIRGRSIAVIDILSLMNHGEVSALENDMQVTETYIGYAIVMEGCGYAIACDEIGAIESIHPGNIRWNNSGFNNRCYSGVVATRLCPLLDIEHVDELVMAMPFVQSPSGQPGTSL